MQSAGIPFASLAKNLSTFSTVLLNAHTYKPKRVRQFLHLVVTRNNCSLLNKVLLLLLLLLNKDPDYKRDSSSPSVHPCPIHTNRSFSDVDTDSKKIHCSKKMPYPAAFTRQFLHGASSFTKLKLKKSFN